MKINTIAAVTLGLVATSALAYAGAKYTQLVYITKNADGSGTMGGSLSSTRNSSDTTARFGCYYENFTAANGGYQYASCYGTDGSKSLSCSTTDPALTDTISKLTGDGYLWVQVDANARCVRVQIGSQSFTPPKLN
jgi:hypothetical protein